MKMIIMIIVNNIILCFFFMFFMFFIYFIYLDKLSLLEKIEKIIKNNNVKEYIPKTFKIIFKDQV
jgi:hypothetical protein